MVEGDIIRVEISREDEVNRWYGRARPTADCLVLLGTFRGVTLVGNGLEQVMVFVPGQKHVPDFSMLPKALVFPAAHGCGYFGFWAAHKRGVVEVRKKTIVVHSFKRVHQFVVPYAFYRGMWAVGEFEGRCEEDGL